MADILMVVPAGSTIAGLRLESWSLDGWQPAPVSVYAKGEELQAYHVKADGIYRGDLLRASYRVAAGGEWSDWSGTLAVTVAESRPAPTPVPEPGLSGGLLIGAVALALVSLRTQKPAPR